MYSSIAAVSKNFVIGKEGRIPWKVKGEQTRFKELTLGKTIIMGRKSFEEIGKPLPGRNTIIISNTISVSGENCMTLPTLYEAMEATKDMDEVFLAGGGRVYEEAMPYVERIYLTVIDMELKGDTYFPAIDGNEFKITYEERIAGEIPYTYYTYERKYEREL